MKGFSLSKGDLYSLAETNQQLGTGKRLEGLLELMGNLRRTALEAVFKS